MSRPRLSWILPASFALALAGAALASPLEPLVELEVRAWTADEHELPAIETEIVRHVQTTPDSPMAHYLLSHMMVRSFSRDPSDLYVLKQAADIAQQAIDLAPRSDYGYVALANVLDLMGQADRGLALLDEAARQGLEPTWRLYFTRSRLLADDAKVANVLGLLETALAFTDAQPRIVVPYVVALLHSQANGKALVQSLDRWNQRFPSPLFELTAAITHAELGEQRRASEIYASILKGNPDNKEAKVNYAIVLYRDLKEPAKATALLEDVLRRHASRMPAATRAMVLAHMGAAYLQAKSFDKAGEAFERAVLQDARNLSVVDFATRSYREAKAPEAMVALIRRLNDIVPGTGVLHALLGETLSEKLDQHDAALRAYSDAIILEPERSDFYNGMGLAHYRKKSYPAALKAFVTASSVDPSDATARYNEACVLALMGRRDEAMTTLAEALTLDPRLAQNARDDADFAQIKREARFQQLVQQPAGGPADGSVGDVIGH